MECMTKKIFERDVRILTNDSEVDATGHNSKIDMTPHKVQTYFEYSDANGMVSDDHEPGMFR